MRTTRAITRTLTVTAAAGLLAAASLTVAVPASAVAADEPDEQADEQPDGERTELRRQRAAVACARIPNVVQRTENLQERLAGDEGTRGSLAWLADRADQAEERGRGELAEVLRTRLEVRTQLVELLPSRLAALVSAQELCDEAGL